MVMVTYVYGNGNVIVAITVNGNGYLWSMGKVTVTRMSLKPYRATSHWKKIRLEILRRDAYTCAYCGDTANEVDHIVPKVKGGEDSHDNLVAACRRCNIQKKDQDEAVFLARRSTPPDFAESISPRLKNQSKSVQNGHTSVRIDKDSPFYASDQSGAN